MIDRAIKELDITAKDIIFIWRCNDCCCYEVNFNATYLHCQFCGKEMGKFKYAETDELTLSTGGKDGRNN